MEEHEIEQIIRHGISRPLSRLCNQLARGTVGAGSEIKDLERELGRSIAQAIHQAVKNGVTEEPRKTINEH